MSIYNNSNINYTVIQKKLNINTKNKFIHFYFLTNNFILLNNINFINFFFIKKNRSLLIKKNHFFFKKFLNTRRLYFFFKKFIFKYKILYNFYYKLLFFKNIFFLKKKKISKNNFFSKYDFLLNFIFFKNWNYLIGGSISPFNWDSYGKKKWFRKSISLNLYKNNILFNKNTKKNIINKSIINKKFFINNYFYFTKNKNTYNSFNYLLKNSNYLNLISKKNYDWFFIKPYLFLNNYEINRNYLTYNNGFTLFLFRNYLRFFLNFKKKLFILKIKKTTDMFFKNNFKLNKFFCLKKFNQKFNLFYFNYNNNFNFLNYFFYKNNLFNNFFLSKKIKNLKKKMKSIFFFKLKLKTKMIKKNKILNLFMYNIKNKKIKAPSCFFLNKKNRVTRRLKKTWLIFNMLSFVLKKNKLNWYKKTFFFKSNFNFKNNFFFYKKFKKIYFNFFNFKNNFFFYKKFKKIFVLKNLNKFFFYSKEKTSFILNSYSFLLTTSNLINFFFKLNKNYSLKKIIFSFSYKNEIERFILKKYTKINVFSSNNNLNLNYYSYFNNINNSTYWNFFNETKTEAFFLLNQNFFYSKNWNFFNNSISNIISNAQDNSNFNIRRVRFKPGYMTMWREVRQVLKNSLSLNFNYQYRLTNYLNKYNKFVKFKSFLFLETSLLNILIKSRFFPDNTIINAFVDNNLVFVNGQSCSNKNFQIFQGDFIQLIIHLKYYILYKWILNLSLKKKNKLKKVTKKKINVQFSNDEKKKSNRLPNWILYNKNIHDDVSKYLEVDYFTLSIFIIYEPFLWNDINFYNIIDQKFSIINLYNWKYIT